MGLQEYVRKRDFGKTPEPRGRAHARKQRALRFVVQKHAATRLHYDFRLEWEGVLKSWAVPKGPSLDPADKRLAVEVEDHPIEYGGFEGVIPKGQYGGGSVLLWDRGTWEPIGDAGQGLRRGKLEFTLDGEKLRGKWLLVRTASGDKPQWLLRKLADDEARPGSDGGITSERPESVDTGRTIEEIGARPARVWHSHRAAKTSADAASLPQARKGALPPFVRPQLATLVAEPPRGAGWLHEIKLDGYRALCRIEKGRARFLTRAGNDWTDTFGRLASAAAFLPADKALLDGEVVWLEPDGRTSFQALQGALGDGRDERLFYFAFDLLHLDGQDLTRAPLLARKEALRALLAAAPAEAHAHLRYTDHVEGEGEPFFRQACRIGVEGIVSKRADAAYHEGRSKEWLKIKCLAEQEFVVVGWTDPSGSRQGLGALQLGVYQQGELRHVGKVGTGFDDRTLRELHARLAKLERDTPPVVNPPRGYKARGTHWVEPRLVAQVAFTEWTKDGVLRHPSFQGLREDKEAREVVRERPADEATETEMETETETEPKTKKATKREAAASAKVGGTAKRSRAGASPAPTSGRSPRRATAAPRSRKSSSPSPALELAGIRITNPDRVLYPEQGITKGELATYYDRVADLILPYIEGRPLTLVRCPNGRQKECFYQKHLADATPPELVEVPVTERSGAHRVYVAAESAAGLLTLPQMGVLELHPWGSTRHHLNQPDILIFDLDPGPGISWSACIDAARDLRDLLREMGLESFPKLSGGKGVHVVVPIRPQLEWDAAKAFTRAVVQLLASREPDRYTTVMAKAKRQGRIFLDYLRNGFGNTAVAPYSTRARAGAPIAVPIRWDELKPACAPDQYDIRNIGRRLARMKRDPWDGFFTLVKKQGVPKAVLKQLKVA